MLNLFTELDNSKIFFNDLYHTEGIGVYWRAELIDNADSVVLSIKDIEFGANELIYENGQHQECKIELKKYKVIVKNESDNDTFNIGITSLSISKDKKEINIYFGGL